jgi:hypothetical protein
MLRACEGTLLGACEGTMLGACEGTMLGACEVTVLGLQRSRLCDEEVRAALLRLLEAPGDCRRRRRGDHRGGRLPQNLARRICLQQGRVGEGVGHAAHLHRTARAVPLQHQVHLRSPRRGKVCESDG